MKTVFTITADTDKMKVMVDIFQGGKLMHSKRYPTVTDALAALLTGIDTVMAERGEVK